MEMALKKFKISNLKFQIIRTALIFIVLTVLFSKYSFADSDYVLPYPSTMPGSKFYLLHQLFEKAEGYWYFGDFAKFHYNLKYSDKYLVEAKTLFEYKQYLLASKSLEKSDSYFTKTKLSLGSSKSNNKNTKEKEGILKNVSVKHKEVLNGIKMITPEEFYWNPEKGKPANILIGDKINESIKIRDL